MPKIWKYLLIYTKTSCSILETRKEFGFLCENSLTCRWQFWFSKFCRLDIQKQGKVSSFSAGTFPVKGNYMHRKQCTENYQKRLSQNRGINISTHISRKIFATCLTRSTDRWTQEQRDKQWRRVIPVSACLYRQTKKNRSENQTTVINYDKQSFKLTQLFEENKTKY